MQFSTLLCPYEVVKGLFWTTGPIVLDNQGNIYLGYDEYSIVKYSPKGEELLRMGRRGEGPGDLRRLSSYAYNPKDNLIYVTEYFEGNRRISMFTTEGKFAGAWNFEMDWLKYGVVCAIDFDNQGNVLLEVEKQSVKRFKDFSVDNSKKELLKFSPKGKLLASIYRMSADSSGSTTANFTATIPFQNSMNWVIFQNKIIVKETSSDFISILSPEGKLEKKIPFPVKKEKVTDKDIENWENHLNSARWIQELQSRGRGNVKFWSKRLPFPAYKPNSSSISVDANGNLYVREYTQFYSEQKKRDPIWFKINLQNGNIARLKFKAGEELSLIWKNYFIFFKIDEDEEEMTTITKIEEKELQKW